MAYQVAYLSADEFAESKVDSLSVWRCYHLITLESGGALYT